MHARVLVLAGHDPTGGAGVDADREAVVAAGGVATCVVTNRTDQDGRCVRAVEPVAGASLTSEARRAFTADVRAIKTGLLSSAEQVDAVCDLVLRWRAERPDLWVVVDPVLAASGGEVFLDGAGRERLLARLRDLGAVLTPNVLELAALTGTAARVLEADPARREEAARGLLERGARAVCAKGGHGTEDPVVDLVVERATDGSVGIARLARPRLAGRGMHGSGCRYASHLAAGLAAGRPLTRAAEAAGEFLQRLLAAGG
jgi:hydroxymethylpyrimidine/phosphomethylpyrimidine kinase